MTDGGGEAVLYYRDGCHLCEELAAVLFRGWPEHAAAVQWRDVDSDPAWRETYGLRVPVLLIGERLVCEFRPDIRRLSECFGEPVNSL
ncbi:MAG: glutaredoxin family protein [Gammaproteobacteria bacterium]|nr:glutaredoxin family protein [Gammaproteobacteria bacterium]